MTDLSGYAAPDLQPGTVWLVGAGPGDPGLISWLGLHALQSADAVLYDSGLDPEILSLVPAGTFTQPTTPSGDRRVAVERCIDLARDGWRVVRLVEGDPFASGDGAEEALAYVAAGIGFRVVPGITPTIAGPGYAGVPVTHRDANSAVVFITLEDAIDPSDAARLAQLAASGAAIVATIRPDRLSAVAETLLDAGVAATAPTLLISYPASKRQTIVETTLFACKSPTGIDAVAPRLLLVLGAVVGLRRHLVANPPPQQAPQALAFSMAGFAG